MCLEVIDKIYRDTDNCVIVKGYQVKRKKVVGRKARYYSLVHHQRYSMLSGMWYESEWDKLDCSYKKGFHIWRNKKAALKWNRSPFVIVEVRGRGVLAKGKESVDSSDKLYNVVICREAMIVKESIR